LIKKLFFQALFGAFTLSAAHAAVAGSPDALLMQSLVDISHSRMDSALSSIDSLLKSNPNFRLAQLIRGDILLAHSRPISTLGNVSGAPQERIQGLREEAVARVKRQEDRPGSNTVPSYIVEMRPEQKYAVVVDLEKSALYLYKNDNGSPKYVADFYITSGKKTGEKVSEGDKKTPIGVYSVTEHLPASKLPAFYGTGAFPISYPNEWDRHEGRSGHGIWLHGTPPDTYSRVPKASSGCVVLANHDLNEIGSYLQVGITPVIIADSIKWENRHNEGAMRDSVDEALGSWRHDWETLDNQAYLAHYSKQFFSGDMNYSEWAKYKSQVNASKSWVKIGISNVSAFLYPGKTGFFVVSFDQDYSSNNFHNKMRKRQYWIKEGDTWKIIYEGNA
jgi:murein L,D-transpeptidase YafK